MKRFNPERELNKIQHGNKNKVILFVISLLVVGIIGYSFALYQVRYGKRIIYTKVAPFSTHDLDLAIYVDGSPDKLPEKGEKYYYESISCENDPNATAEWDYANQKLDSLSAITIPNKCDIHFISHSPKLSEQIKYISGTNSKLVLDDETLENNLRYVGANEEVSNYIWFNCNDYNGITKDNAESKGCEKWRIIGLFRSVPKPDGSSEDLVKIIRADSIGSMAWDTAKTNNWTRPATLQTSLTSYYNGQSLGTGKGITGSTKNMIEYVTWNIGAGDGQWNIASHMYAAERGTTVVDGASSTWDGYIGLMYPSDYGYAAGKSCWSINLDSYNNNCYNSDWLFSSSDQWTISPDPGLNINVYIVSSTGYVTVSFDSSDSTRIVRPSLYLASDVKIVSGDGSSGTPYILSA